MKKILMAGAVLAAMAVALPAQAATVSSFGDATGTGPWTMSSTGFTSYGGVEVDPSGPLTFAGISSLSASFTDTTGGAGGGSPRLSVGLNTGSGEAFMHILLGTSPNFNDTVASLNAGSGMNVIGNNDAGRYDISQFGGSSFTDYNAALALVGSLSVMEIDFVLDGGWAVSGGTQLLTLNSLNINGATFSNDVGATPLPGALAMFGPVAGAGLLYLKRRKRKQGTPALAA